MVKEINHQEITRYFIYNIYTLNSLAAIIRHARTPSSNFGVTSALTLLVPVLSVLDKHITDNRSIPCLAVSMVQLLSLSSSQYTALLREEERRKKKEERRKKDFVKKAFTIKMSRLDCQEKHRTPVQILKS